MAAEMANVRARVQVPVIGEFKIFTKKRLDRFANWNFHRENLKL